jgi:hypothetical protein
MCSRLSTREKLILLNPPNFHPRLFRIEWQPLSVSATRKFARLEMLFGRTRGSRGFAGAPPFYPEPRRACPACPESRRECRRELRRELRRECRRELRRELRRECRRELRRVVFRGGILKLVAFLISGVPTVITSEEALVRASREFPDASEGSASGRTGKYRLRPRWLSLLK